MILQGGQAWASVFMQDVWRRGWGDGENQQQQQRWLSLSNIGAVTQQAETQVLLTAMVPEAECLDKDRCQDWPRNALHAVPAWLLGPLQQVLSAMSNLAKRLPMQDSLQQAGTCAGSAWALHCTACQAGRQPHLRLAMSSISSSTMMLHSPMAASTTTATSTL